MENNKQFVSKIEFYTIVGNVYFVIFFSLFAATIAHKSRALWVLAVQIFCLASYLSCLITANTLQLKQQGKSRKFWISLFIAGLLGALLIGGLVMYYIK